MGRKIKYSKDIIIKSVKEYQDGLKSISQIANDLGCSTSSVKRWVNSFKTMGEKAFKDKANNKSYSKEFKLKAINDYLEGKGSLNDIIKKYEIYSVTTLWNWIIKYNSHIEIKDYKSKGDVYMAKSRKTTYEERLKVVKHCIKNGKSYTLTANEFDLPYTQVYNWVKKYIKEGKEGLKDRRGRNKAESELTDTEKLKREIQRLQDKNERLEMENVVLKKLNEVERRLSSAKSGKKRNTSQ